MRSDPDPGLFFDGPPGFSWLFLAVGSVFFSRELNPVKSTRIQNLKFDLGLSFQMSYSIFLLMLDPECDFYNHSHYNDGKHFNYDNICLDRDYVLIVIQDPPAN